jgi:hypothetical protein
MIIALEVSMKKTKKATMAKTKAAKKAVPSVAQTIESLTPGVSFDLVDPRVVDHLRTHGADRMSAPESTKAAIANTLADGVVAGETRRELASRVQDVLAEQPVAPMRELAGPAQAERVTLMIDATAALLKSGVPKTAAVKRVERELRLHAKKPFGPRGLQILETHIRLAFPEAV